MSYAYITGIPIKRPSSSSSSSSPLSPLSPLSKTKCSADTTQHHRQTTTTRRQFLRYITLSTTLVLPTVATVSPAHADRTGKYSTKLTAKRRYLPRIARGMEALRRANETNDTTSFLDVCEDFVTALRLFGTSYFAEGNRIGPIERKLTTNVETIEQEIETLVAASNSNDRDKAVKAIVEAVDQYVDTAKIEDSLVSIGGLKK